MTGRIYKGIGGFYYIKVDGEDALREVKPRGIFRKRGIKPLAGDKVRLACEAGTWYIDEILPRTNALVRPPVANVDQLCIVASTTQPVPSTLVIDKLSAVAVDMEAQPVLVVTKGDLAPTEALLEAYAKAGFPVFAASAENGEGLDALRRLLAGRLTVFCGNSGVGKSTLLNALLPGLSRQTGEISQKLGRGKHTTREVELFEVPGTDGEAAGLVADTPGFASFDLQRTGGISADNMQFAFPEIAQRMPACKFSGCTHTSEVGCEVRSAVEAGDITPSRYQGYVALYEEAKEAENNRW